MENETILGRILMVTALLLLAACGGGSSSDSGSGTAGGGGGDVSGPVIITQPVSQSVVAGTTATFAVTSSGASGYQWQRSTDGGANYSDVSGAIAASYTTPSTTAADNGQRFRVMVSGASNTVTSNPATLTVSELNVSTVLFQRSYNYGAVSNMLTIKDDGSGGAWLTTGTDQNVFAALTPAKQIIYRHVSSSLPQESGLYVMNQDGSGKTALIANDATASYQGRSESGRIVYSRSDVNGSTGLYSTMVDGTGTVTIANPAIFYATAPGDRAIYAGDALYSAKSDGSMIAKLTANVPGQVDRFSGVDGQGRIVFASYSSYGVGGVYRVSADGGVATELAHAAIAFEYGMAGITRTGRVVLSGTSGSFPTRLIDEGGSTLVESASGVDYLGSTKLGQVIYRRRADGSTGSSIDLYITEATGGKTIALAAEPGIDENFEYVTDSGRVIYSTSGGVYAVNSDGTARSTLALNNNVYVVFKAVLGNAAIYEQTEGGTVTYLYAVNLDGTGTIPLLNSGGSAYFSGITPGGRILVRREPGSVDLWVVDANGSNPRALANSGENEVYLAAF